MADIKKIMDGDFLSSEGALNCIVDKVNELIEGYNEHCHHILPDNRIHRDDVPVTGYPIKHPNSSI